MNIDDKIIRDFREVVNSNSNFVFETYHSKNGKNLWNIICSCMDWISVSVRFLSNKIELHEDINVRVMQFFSIISAIDIVNEAVSQLHRVIINPNEIPFKNKQVIFKENKLNLDDNKYFKEIRAMFGAHPVNLTHNGDQKWYASWPYDHHNSKESTFELRLYSNKIDTDDITFGINIIDLENFLLQRYNYLKHLKLEINNQYKLFCEKLSNQNIEIKEQPLINIKILEQESKRRLNNDYYNGIIYELKKIFSTTLNEEHLIEEETNYKNSLLQVITELKNNLQNMKITELTTSKIINPDYSYSEIGYTISQLYAHDFNLNREPLFDFHMKKLDKYSNNRYNFSKTNNPDAVFLKLNMMLYRKSKLYMEK